MQPGIRNYPYIKSDGNYIYFGNEENGRQGRNKKIILNHRPITNMRKPLSTGRAILYASAAVIIVVCMTPLFNSSQRIAPWHYDTPNDGSKSATTYAIYKDATENANIVNLFIQENNNTKQIFVKGSESGFVSDSDSTVIQIKFDENNFEGYEAILLPTGDGSSLKNIMILNSEKIYSELIKYNKLTIRADLYQNGVGEAEFNISNYKDDNLL